MSEFDLSSFQVSGATGMDALFQREAQQKKAVRQKVASLNQLQGFVRISNETLVHKSTRDLWALQKEADGSIYIQRLFDDNGEPIKG